MTAGEYLRTSAMQKTHISINDIHMGLGNKVLDLSNQQRTIVMRHPKLQWANATYLTPTECSEDKVSV